MLSSDLNEGIQISVTKARRARGKVLSLSSRYMAVAFEATDADLRMASLRLSGEQAERGEAHSVYPAWRLKPAPEGFKFVGHRTKALQGGGVRLEMRWRSPEGIAVKQAWELYPDSPVLRLETSLYNGSPHEVVVSEPGPLNLTFEMGAACEMYRLRGHSYLLPDDPTGKHYGLFTLQCSPLEGEAEIFSGPRSSKAYVPWYLLYNSDTQRGLVGGLAWSGQWRLSFKRRGATVTVRGGEVGNQAVLLPGQRYMAPVAFVCPFSGSPDEGRNIFTHYLQNHEMPPVPEDFPWAQYNSWYAYNISITEEQLRKEAEIAADLGLEVFYIDSGWYRGSGFGDGFGVFSKGLGDWHENRAKFPGGLRTFAGEMRRRGLQFGIWVEPERVDLSTEGRGGGGWKSDWLAWRDGEPIPSFHPQAVQLCFGSPDARRWAKRWLGRLASEYGLRWMKWDGNMWGICTRSDHGHGGHEGEKAQVEGLYDVVDSLRRRFPDLVLENCAAGGHRLDYGLVHRTHVGWVSDDTWPSVRVRHHAAGAAWAFPLLYLNSWVVQSRQETIGPGTSKDELRYIFRSRMLGAFGISARMSEWPGEIRDLARHEVALYKRLRPLIRDNRFYPLLAQSDLVGGDDLKPQESWEAYVDADLRPVDPWEAYELLSWDSARGALLVFRHGGEVEQRSIQWRALEATTQYRLRDEDSGEEFTFSGHQLMTEGLDVTIRAPKGAAVYWLAREC